MKKLFFLGLLAMLLVGCTAAQKKTDGNKLADANVSDSNQMADKNISAGQDDANKQDKLPDKNAPAEKKKWQLFVFVKDLDGNNVAGAKVSLDSLEEGFVHSDRNNSDGNGFILFNAPEGNYRILAEKDGFITSTLEKKIVAGTQNIVNVAMEKPKPEFEQVKWKKNLNDGNISIDPAGFLKAQRGERRLVLNIAPDFIGELGNKAFEWRLKIMDGSITGFNVSLELFTPTKKLVKVQHSVDRVNLVGADITRTEVDLKSDYHTFKLVINSEEKATLFIDGKEVAGNKTLSSGIPVADPKRLFFETYKGLTSIDYFYVDIDNDGKWDYKEDWNDLANVS